MPTDNLLRKGKVVRESPSGRAWLVLLDHHDEPLWLPKSQVEAYDNDTLFSIPPWLAREKEIT